jgi:hypothetical protein
VNRFLSRLMGAFAGEGQEEITRAAAAKRLAVCHSNRCGIFDAKTQTCVKSRGGCGCHMPVKVTYARVKVGGKTEVVRCPVGLW